VDRNARNKRDGGKYFNRRGRVYTPERERERANNRINERINRPYSGPSSLSINIRDHLSFYLTPQEGEHTKRIGISFRKEPALYCRGI
jgi:hypothetical protein